MADQDVTLIRPDIALKDAEPVQEVIDMLRDALARAERGEVRAVALVGCGELEQPFRFSGKAGELSEHGHTLIGQMFVMKQDLSGMVS